MTSSNEPLLPRLDLDILDKQLEELYLKAIDAVKIYNAYLTERKVPNSYFSPWYQWQFEETDSPAFNIADGEVYWSDTDREGDYISMSCPASVLTGESTPEEWAERTYTRWMDAQHELAQEEYKKWLDQKEQRRLQFLRLKKEFDHGEAS